MTPAARRYEPPSNASAARGTAPRHALVNGQQATLGVMGGGQLGRMFVQAAQRMGYFTVVLDADPASPAGPGEPIPHSRPITWTSKAWRS